MRSLVRSGRGSLVVTLVGVVAVVLATLGAPAPDRAQPPSTPVDVTGAAVTAVPHYDHVVVLVDENHTREQVVGNPAAPWINALAAGGANLTSSYGITHPSQPNYLALFSGSTQGLVDDSCPHSYTGPNLATQLSDANLTFAGYSETLPAAGSTTCFSNGYARKHNPWVDFPAVAPVANQPFTSFPSDYSTLPSVSFVVPNLTNDMHDGTVAQGDAWLAANLDGYVRWAKTHNSLFVLTFDEDDNSAANRIPTVVAGAHVRPGDYSAQVNHYNLLRTIEDSFGLAPIGQAATSAPILSIFAAPGDDQAPTASFTSTCGVASCTFDASGSSDPDGSVVSWVWDFGDGITDTGVRVTHPYTEAGQYDVGLTVTDDRGAATSTSRQVVGGGGFAIDGFNRTVTSGLGVADLGGRWTPVGDTANSSVAPGAAAFRLPTPGSQTGALLASTTRTDTEVLTRTSLSTLPVGGPVYVTVKGRRVSSGNEYSAKLLVYPDRSVTLRLIRVVAGAETTLGAVVKLPGVAYVAGTPLRIRLQVTGASPTALRARAWPVGDAEPATWQVSATDASTGLQAAGATGLVGYVSSAITNTPITVAFGELRARPTSRPANVAPTPAIDATCTQLTCTLDGTRSSDADGRVASWAWDFGDGAVASGATTSHAYAAAGSYTVTLAVTDDSGATATTTRTVTTTAPPINQPPVARFTTACTGRVCTFDGSASSDEEGVRGWTWDFGDGGSATGRVVTHTYVDGGQYQVRLTVADEYDATGSLTQPVTVAGPFVRDTFGRVVDNGWGRADVGGAWALGGSAAGFSVRPGYGTVRLATAGAQLSAFLTGAKSAASDVTTALRASTVPVGGPLYLTVSGRRVSSGNEYATKVLVYPDRSVTLRVVRVVGGAETVLGGIVKLPGVLYAPGMVLNVRVQVAGSSTSTVRAKAWPSTSGEPATWQVSGTDSTAALKVPGYVGLVAYLSSAATNPPISVDVTSLVADTP